MAAPRRNGNPAPKLYAFDRGAIDNISRYLHARKLVPEEFRDSDKFVDIVSWNLRWFDHRDPARIKAITEVMSEMNSDVFVLTEVAEDGALDQVISALSDRKAGQYSQQFGTTGGQQRVVLMWDRDWIRSKRGLVELFHDDQLQITDEDGHRADVFPRLPLWGYFEALPQNLHSGSDGFNFELVGLHLKSQMVRPGSDAKRGGIKQRTNAAKCLADWLGQPAAHFDEDVILAGDWNATPDEQEWGDLRRLEQQGRVVFSAINPAGQITHIARFNAGGSGGSRLDMHLVNTPAAAAAVPRKQGVVVRWSLFDDLAALTSAERQKMFKNFTHFISDHHPVLSRFYMVDKDQAANGRRPAVRETRHAHAHAGPNGG